MTPDSRVFSQYKFAIISILDPTTWLEMARAEFLVLGPRLRGPAWNNLKTKILPFWLGPPIELLSNKIFFRASQMSPFFIDSKRGLSNGEILRNYPGNYPTTRARQPI